MSDSLPARPDLDQLRRKAKDLRNAAHAGDRSALDRIAKRLPGGDPSALSTAQIVIAREHGFASWPALHAEIENRTTTLAGHVEAFLYESVAGHARKAAQLLRDYPTIATHDFRTAAVAGEVELVRRALGQDAALAARPDPRSGWTALHAVCMSHWPRIEPDRAPGLREVAQLLLDAGADPNATVGDRPGQPGYCAPLFAAAGCRGNAELTALLLDRGASADAHTVYLAAFHDDHRPLELLLDRGLPVDDTALAAPLTTGDVDVVRLLIRAGADPSRPIPPEALGEGDPGDLPVCVAVKNGHSAELVDLLLEHGGDATAPGRDGQSPYRLAVRQGRTDLLAVLARYGAVDDATEVDLFISACARADRAAAEGALRRTPGLISQLAGPDLAAVVDASDHGDVAAVELMLDVGFPIDARGEDGATPLHAAAAAGSIEVVRLLLDRGANVHAQDTTWNSAPAVWASVGSGMHLGRCPGPDWVATMELLIGVGASIDNAWLTGAKAPSPEMAQLLRAHGVVEPAGG